MREKLEKYSINGDYMLEFPNQKQKIKLNNEELP